MKTRTELKCRSLMPFAQCRVALVGGVVFFLGSLMSLAQTNTVTVCTEAALRTAMAGGGTVLFACDGTITLARTITNFFDTTLDGTGHQITISGGNAVRVFYVSAGQLNVEASTFDSNLVQGGAGASATGSSSFSTAFVKRKMSWTSCATGTARNANWICVRRIEILLRESCRVRPLLA
jgi:hypothetical protein